MLAAETTAEHSNFYVDQPGLAAGVGAHSIRVTSPDSAAADAAGAYALARDDRRTVVLNLPLEIQSAPAPSDTERPPASGSGGQHRSPDSSASPLPSGQPTTADVAALVQLLAAAERPVIIAGRGARHAGAELADLGDACGALLATSAVAKGLFNPNPWSLDVSGGFASPVAAELIADADVIVGFGCALNMWTTRHGRLIGTEATLVQVDLDPGAIGAHRPVEHGIVGDSALTAAAAAQALWELPEAPPGYRDHAIQQRLRDELRWRDLPYDDWGDGVGEQARIDPRTLTIALDDILPHQRIVAVDSGNFMGYPSAYLSVPDENGFCFTQSFQSIGLGLATAVGAALARPDRLPVAALGDGGALMAAAELDTVRRLGLPMVVVVYNDDAYGAEVHHFRDGEPLDTVTFPDTDIAAIGAGYGFDAVTVHSLADLEPVERWVRGPRERPLLIDAKIAAPQGAWWLEEAFRGH